MSNFTITNLKKHLNSMTKEELIVEIADLVKNILMLRNIIQLN